LTCAMKLDHTSSVLSDTSPTTTLLVPIIHKLLSNPGLTSSDSTPSNNCQKSSKSGNPGGATPSPESARPVLGASDTTETRGTYLLHIHGRMTVSLNNVWNHLHTRTSDRTSLLTILIDIDLYTAPTLSNCQVSLTMTQAQGTKDKSSFRHKDKSC